LDDYALTHAYLEGYDLKKEFECEHSGEDDVHVIQNIRIRFTLSVEL